MDRALLDVRADLASQPFHRFRARFEHVTAVAADFRRHQRFERRVEPCLQFPKARVGKASERDISRASGEDADPRLTVLAQPQRAVVVSVRVGVVACTCKDGWIAAIVTIWAGKGFGWFSDAHRR